MQSCPINQEFGLLFSGSLDQLAIEIAKTSKTGVGRVSDDDVIEDFDFEKLTGSNEVPSNFDVRLGWCRIAARMIMRDDDCRRTRHNRQSKNLPGMTKDRIHRANGHQIMTFDAPTC